MGSGWTMISKVIRVRNRLGLHARAAARFVQTASKFKSIINLSKVDSSLAADGRSILEILMLAAHSGTKLVLTISGEDENEALESLLELIEDKFGED